MSKNSAAPLVAGIVIGAVCAAGTIAACVAIQRAKQKKALAIEEDLSVLEEAE